jgi:hypothetical protein
MYNLIIYIDSIFLVVLIYLKGYRNQIDIKVRNRSPGIKILPKMSPGNGTRKKIIGIKSRSSE